MSTINISNKNIDGNAAIWEGTLENLPFTRKFLDEEVKWELNSRSELEHSSYKQERKEFTKEFSSTLNDWLDEVKQNNSILDILADLLSTEENKKHFFKLYPIEGKDSTIREYLHRNCDVLYNVIRDEPGFKMAKHFDNRAVFGNMFFNLIDNESVSTQFYRTFDDGSLEKLNPETHHYYNAPVRKGGGIFFLNSYDTLHNIIQNSDKNRYVLNIVIYFKDLTW